jgi:hypothetical protein
MNACLSWQGPVAVGLMPKVAEAAVETGAGAVAEAAALPGKNAVNLGGKRLVEARSPPGWQGGHPIE